MVVAKDSLLMKFWGHRGVFWCCRVHSSSCFSCVICFCEGCDCCMQAGMRMRSCGEMKLTLPSLKDKEGEFLRRFYPYHVWFRRFVLFIALRCWEWFECSSSIYANWCFLHSCGCVCLSQVSREISSHLVCITPLLFSLFLGLESELESELSLGLTCIPVANFFARVDVSFSIFFSLSAHLLSCSYMHTKPPLSLDRWQPPILQAFSSFLQVRCFAHPLTARCIVGRTPRTDIVGRLTRFPFTIHSR